MRGYPDYKHPRHPARKAGVRVLAIGIALAMPTAAIAATPVADAGPDEPELARDAALAGELAEQSADDAVENRGGKTLTVAGGARVAAGALRSESEDVLDPGPFDPLDAEPDYGDVEAAFGNARGRPHEGQDMFAPDGTRIVAPTDGIVIDEGADGGRGNWLAVYDPERRQTYNFFHMNAPALVAKGESVDAGQKVGEVGCTGSCWGTHLHFEVRAGRDPYGTASDPLPLLERWPRIGD